MSRSGILAAGNWIVDHVKMIEEFPRQDALVSITSESDSNGGGPYNLLKDLALLGASFPLSGAGLVGDDANGAAILAECDALGIDRSQIAGCDAPTSYTDVMTVKADGRRTFFHQRGANARFDGAAIDFATTNAKIFYLGYLLLLDALDEVREDGTTRAVSLLERASACGHITAVDLVSAQSGRFQEIVRPALPHIDFLFLNEYEAGCFLGREIDAGDREQMLSAAKDIRAMGVRRCAIIHSPGGVAAGIAPGAGIWQGSVKLPEARIAGAVGAGDAFAAGMLLGVHDEKPLEECLIQAVCAAALCLTEPSTSGGMAPLDEAIALGTEFGFR